MSIECHVNDATKPNCFHVVIVGGGPAAVSAAIYCHRFNLKTLMIGQEYGGAIGRTYLVENYPGFFNISGLELMEAFQKHYEFFQIPYIFDSITTIARNPEHGYDLNTAEGKVYTGCAVILCTGTRYRELHIPGEKEFHGRGVSYCATCDGPFFRDKDIVVIGGSDSAAVEALFLSRFARKVSIIYRREKIRAEPINIVRCEKNDRIQIIPNTLVTSINGKQSVESVTFQSGQIFPTSAVFIEIGAIPQSDLAQSLGVKLNQEKEIMVDRFAQTNVSGIFAAGDVTDIREKQVITACGQGVTAAYSVREYLEQSACID